MDGSQTETVGRVDLSKFNSPLRILARSFLVSRDKWKQKCLQAKSEIKRFQNKAADAVKSRERWKQKFEQQQARAERLEAELAEVRAARAARDESPSAAGVKTSRPRRRGAAVRGAAAP